MTRLEWTIEYSVGVPKIDQQHAYLFELANRLFQHMGMPDATQIIDDTITELHRYVDTHFAYEEAILKKADYEHYEEHKQMHELMRTRLDLLTQQLKQGALNRQDLVEFMESWLTEHIIMEDMRFIPAVAKLSEPPTGSL